MRVHVVDPPAYTPPYDHALCAALAVAGVEVELYTSRFAYASAPDPIGYDHRDFFYRHPAGAPGSRRRRASRIAEHPLDMRRYRSAATAADLVHFQWLAVAALDGLLLPRRRPLVLTAHDILSREGSPARRAGQRRLYRHFDAVIAHSQHGRRRLIDELGVPDDRVHVIAHGAFTHLAALPAVALPPELEPVSSAPVVLCFGLIRPYKGIDVLLEAWRKLGADAQLWIVGRPRMALGPLRALAPPGVRWVPRFVSDGELAACFRRADLVVLPYREIEQSGVLASALAFGSPLVLSDVGGFGEVGAAGGARMVPPGDPAPLRTAIEELLGDEPARARLAAAARALAAGEWSWESVAARTRALYEQLLS